jgi:acyl-CoA dehydrogenase
VEPVHAAVARRDAGRRQLRVRGTGAVNLQYAFCAEENGPHLVVVGGFQLLGPRHRQLWRCFTRYGTREQKDRVASPPDGRARSARLPDDRAGVASSDATNIECRIARMATNMSINGRKWWSSGAGDPRCKVAILDGQD